MISVPATRSQVLRGAAMLLGSLYWEGSNADQDGAKGKRRKKWRDTHLDMDSCRDLKALPIRYGRRSESRCGEFTIVLGGNPNGTAKIAAFRQAFHVANGKLGDRVVTGLKRQVKELAKAEGIWTKEKPTHYTGWGLVAVAINPESPFKDQICELWKKHFRPGKRFEPSEYGDQILNADGMLQIALENEVWNNIDFCLLTPTKPTDPAPSPEEIAAAIKLSFLFQTDVRFRN